MAGSGWLGLGDWLWLAGFGWLGLCGGVWVAGLGWLGLGGWAGVWVGTLQSLFLSYVCVDILKKDSSG